MIFSGGTRVPQPHLRSRPLNSDRLSSKYIPTQAWSASESVEAAPRQSTWFTGCCEIYFWGGMLRRSRTLPRDVSHTLFYGRKGLVIMATSGVDLALWDLRGKQAASRWHDC